MAVVVNRRVVKLYLKLTKMCMNKHKFQVGKNIGPQNWQLTSSSQRHSPHESSHRNNYSRSHSP